MENDLLLKINNLCFDYSENQEVVKELEFTLSANERIGIIGDTGIGKSTVFHLIMGLLKPKSGAISIFSQQMQSERDFAKVRTEIGFLFQHADDQLFSPTVLDDIAFGPLNKGKSTKEAISIAKEVLEQIGLEGFEHRITNELSGGEKKLVALGTILAMRPRFLLLDEPVTGLDRNTKQRVANILNDLVTPYVVVSHDWDFLEKITNKVYKLENGRYVLSEGLKMHHHAHAHPMGDTGHEHSAIEVCK